MSEELIPNDPMLRILATQASEPNSVPSPGPDISYSPGSSGSLSGAYFYLITYVTVLGETAPNLNQAVPVTVSSQSINISLTKAPEGVISRKIYRSVAGGAASDRAVFYLRTIIGRDAATFVDNASDISLGASPSWSSANKGFLGSSAGGVPVARYSDQVTTFGSLAGGPTPSYATTAFGYMAGGRMAGGTRNTLVGVYAGENLTNARENTCIGTHSGGATTTGTGNTCVGYQAGGGGPYRPLGNFNVALGSGSMSGSGGDTSAIGTYNTGVGFQSLQQIVTNISRCIGLGPFAGKYADAASQVYIDNQDRGNATTAKTDSLGFGVGNASMPLQTFAFNAAFRAGGKVTVSQLPSASTALAGHRFVVTDGSVAYTSANIGTTVAGGGSNTVPVFCNGANWVIG